MSVLASTEFLSRTVYSQLTQKLKLSKSQTLLVGIVSTSMMRLALTFAEDFRHILAICALYGIFQAMTVVNFNAIIKSHCEKLFPENRYHQVLALFLIIKGICVIVFGQLFGFIYDQNNFASFHVQNGLIMICIVLWTIEKASIKR